MTQGIEAIYQNGVFKPLNPIMELAENFYEGLPKEDIEEIERIALNRSNFFGDEKLCRWIFQLNGLN